jgi:exodeoxyribonuclease VII large subunit
LRRLDQAHPRRRLQDHAHRLALLGQRLDQAPGQLLRQRRLQLQGLARALASISPLSTLGRGYAILQRADGSVLRRAADAQPGDTLSARLAEGQLRLRVEPDSGH